MHIPMSQKALESPPWVDPLSASAAAPVSKNTSHSLASLIAGASSGCVATVASYPFDLLRTRLAAQQDSKVYASMRAGLAAIVRAHGVRGLFVGLWPTLVGIAPYAALTFGSYERARDTLMVRLKESRRTALSVFLPGFFILFFFFSILFFFLFACFALAVVRCLNFRHRQMLPNRHCIPLPMMFRPRLPES